MPRSKSSKYLLKYTQVIVCSRKDRQFRQLDPISFTLYKQPLGQQNFTLYSNMLRDYKNDTKEFNKKSERITTMFGIVCTYITVRTLTQFQPYILLVQNSCTGWLTNRIIVQKQTVIIFFQCE